MIPSDDYEPPSPEPADRGWHDASPRYAFWRGMAVGGSVPGIILFASAAGFGALARDAGFSLAGVFDVKQARSGQCLQADFLFHRRDAP